MDPQVAPAGRGAMGGRALRTFLIVGFALMATAAFLVGTPLTLLIIGDTRAGGDWAQLSNVGQAYGGMASVLGTFALIGVAASVVLQSRESAASREQLQRTIHNELVFKAMDNLSLQACWGPSIHGNDELDRQHLYTNLVISFWFSMYEVGKITDEQVREDAARMFLGEPGRRYWAVAGPHRLAYYPSRRDLRFARIIDLEYAKAIAHHCNDQPAPVDTALGNYNSARPASNSTDASGP